MKTFIKSIINIILVVAFCVGMVLMIGNCPDDAPLSTLIKVNGSGALMFIGSLVLLSALNKDDAATTEMRMY